MAAVECRPVFYYYVVIFLWSSGIMDCVLFTFDRSCAMWRQWCCIFHYHWWTASIKPRLLFSYAGYASWGISLFSVYFSHGVNTFVANRGGSYDNYSCYIPLMLANKCNGFLCTYILHEQFSNGLGVVKYILCLCLCWTGGVTLKWLRQAPCGIFCLDDDTDTRYCVWLLLWWRHKHYSYRRISLKPHTC